MSTSWLVILISFCIDWKGNISIVFGDGVEGGFCNRLPGHTCSADSSSARLILILECSWIAQDVSVAGQGLDSCNISHRRSWQCVLLMLNVWPVWVFLRSEENVPMRFDLSSNSVLLFLCLTCFPEPSGNHTTAGTFLRCFLAWSHWLLIQWFLTFNPLPHTKYPALSSDVSQATNGKIRT